ncbi:hypothetical protein FA95DRAFT_1567899 [Auriscalpium vulgare]|uniref:Uncharacterized protein n=1 Tax=Auriscalpium vulgare TaxID=40419 RepID=A0ACB8R2K5_9AGAM|nr:hypothetical protein FA95DRAFT_1567899 [Auriscalpium vulgare]
MRHVGVSSTLNTTPASSPYLRNSTSTFKAQTLTFVLFDCVNYSKLAHVLATPCSAAYPSTSTATHPPLAPILHATYQSVGPSIKLDDGVRSALTIGDSTGHSLYGGFLHGWGHRARWRTRMSSSTTPSSTMSPQRRRQRV